MDGMIVLPHAYSSHDMMYLPGITHGPFCGEHYRCGAARAAAYRRHDRGMYRAGSYQTTPWTWPDRHYRPGPREIGIGNNAGQLISRSQPVRQAAAVLPRAGIEELGMQPHRSSRHEWVNIPNVMIWELTNQRHRSVAFRLEHVYNIRSVDENNC